MTVWELNCVGGVRMLMAVIRDSVGLCDVTKSAELIEIEPFF